MRSLGSASWTLLVALLVCGCGGQSLPDATKTRPRSAPPARPVIPGEPLPVPVVAEAGGNRLPGDNVRSDAPRYLIIHADDAGLARSVNRATIEAMERGVVSSVSMMVPCPAFEEFAEYAREHPEGDYGIHLTLNSEFKAVRWAPLLPREEVPGLVDPDGYFWAEEKQTAANARADEVERELSAQIDRALALKVPLSHLDSHMGTLFTRPDLLEVYVNLGIKYKLPVLFVRTGDALRLFPVFTGTDRSIRELAAKLTEERLPVLDRLYMHYSQDPIDQRRAHYQRIIRDLKPGVSELIIHCGYADNELYEITGTAGMRDRDRRLFTEPRMREVLKANNIEVINWKRFHEMSQSRGNGAR